MNMYSFTISDETIYIWATCYEFAITKARRFGRHFFHTTFLSSPKAVVTPSNEQIVLANQINIVLNEPQYHPATSFKGAEAALSAAFAAV